MRPKPDAAIAPTSSTGFPAKVTKSSKRGGDSSSIFQYNAERNGDAWPTHVGLARGYAAVGDNKQALEHAQKAVVQAPDPLNKKSLEDMVKALEQGQSIQ